MQLQYDQFQIDAIMAAAAGGDIIITGGAGTGKTSIIKAIAENRNGGVMLTAPTGKAAARLREATGFDASTVHRALGYDGEEFRGAIAAKFNVPLIVDEASMMDSNLMAHVIAQEPPQLILVGDDAQLPPVGAGQPFHDLLRLRRDRVRRLEICHRNKEAVHAAALAIREGRRPMAQKTESETFSMMQTGDGERTQEFIVNWFRTGALDPFQDVVLACRYGEEDGSGDIRGLNAAIMQAVNPHEPGERWRKRDRVMCNKNFSALDVWNGDMGTVTDVDTDGRAWVELDRAREAGPLLLDRDVAKEFVHAWALSVHKSQGSQWRRVVFVCLRKHVHMLNRALVYTAVTRAKAGCVVCGELDAFYGGINRVAGKQTVLQELGRKAEPAPEPVAERMPTEEEVFG